MTPVGPESADRRRRRRHFAAAVGAVALVLLVVGSVCASRPGTLGFLGCTAVGYGIGVGVAAAFIAVGHNPFSRE